MSSQVSPEISPPHRRRPPRRLRDALPRLGPSAFLRPGHNIWRLERAARAAVLIDAAAFFRAVRGALRKAQRTVFILGWDIDSRTRLVGEDCDPHDGLPVAFAEYLSALVRQRPELTVHLLLWDYSVVYALERELFPTLSLHWSTPRQVRLSLDDELPIGSSHHQKVIVIDDAVAFSGGLDLTIRRWDTPDHTLDNPDRVDPSGKPYRPFHDVQALVDGPAAHALAELVRERWARASCDFPTEIDPIGDPWPEDVTPDLSNVNVGIARTLPAYDGQAEVREVETLFFNSISAARRTIYIENQFLTCTKVAEHLARTLQRRAELEVLIVAPKHYDSWIETHTVRNGRIRFLRLLQQAGVADRVRLVYPEVRDGERVTDTMIHSKICIIDDWLLRVGSANLNNRSMGADTECDLAFEATNGEQRRRIAALRNLLLGEHCGASADEIARSMARTGSMIRTAEEVSRNGHSLQPIDDGPPDPQELTSAIEEVADPVRPLASEFVLDGRGTRLSRMQLSTLLKIALAAVVVIALPLAWQYTALSTLADPDVVRNTFARVAASAWAPLAVIAIFIAGGLVAFPVLVLIAVTAATFGPVYGLAYAAAGSLSSALVTFLIGAWLGKDLLRDYLGPRLDRIRRRIVNQGVISVAAIRLVPVAPFTFVNLVAGASQIRLQDYLAGTVLGMLPGWIVMSALGHQLFQIVTQPTVWNVALLGAAIIGWIAVSVGVQILLSKVRRA